MHNCERLIKIFPQQRLIKAKSGEKLVEALIRHGIFLRSDCGGKGRCGKCRVHKTADHGHPETVASCQYTIDKDISIEIPETSIQSSFIMDKAKIVFPEEFKNRVKHNKTENCFGAAVDLGTTTIAVYLCDMAKKEVISSVAVKNLQAIYGDDVMSRIGAIARDRDNSGKLQELVVNSIEWGLKKLLSSLNDSSVLIAGMVVVGNPTMIHILAGVNPETIGVFPYKPVFYDAKRFSSDQLGFHTDGFQIRTLPNVSGFIGGDTLAAAIGVDFENQPDGSLLIDLGTNGELLLKSRNRLFATSCATGPAFEGATLSCGVQAIPGAINWVNIDDEKRISGYTMVHPSGMPDLKPSGICGAGVINALAQFCRKHIIFPGGAFSSGEKKYTLVPENSGTGQPSIHISQKDVRSVQLGKSALKTGIEFLLKKAGLKHPEKIIIAGAFGAHLNTKDMIRLGMIPKIDPGRIEMKGNSAGSGAVMALCDAVYVDKAVRMASRIETVDLACDIDFQNEFVKNLNFPAD